MLTKDDIVFEMPSERTLLSGSDLFGESVPFELEIGCGKGGFLLRQARGNPQRRYVGIEWANKFFKYAADRMARWGVENVRIIRTDAAEFVKQWLAPDTLSALHIYHPDPWPKKRHHKRRLVQAPFVAAAIRALRPGARWALQTDHAGYFQQMTEIIRAQPELREIPFDDAERGAAEEGAETNYEIKYLREGRPIYRIAFERKA